MTKKVFTIFICSILAAIILLVLSFFREIDEKPEWYKVTDTAEAREYLRECRKRGGSTLIRAGHPGYDILCIEEEK